MWTTIDSPLGELRLVERDGALVALDFLDPVEDDAPTASMVRASARAAAAEPAERDDDEPVLVRAREQLAAYFAGSLTEFDLPLAPQGTDFQQQVWRRLREIPYGATATYGEIARGLGRTGHGARAVGVANGRNPLPVIVPCHRVVGADGSLTGYGGGMDRKRRLLALEQDGLF